MSKLWDDIAKNIREGIDTVVEKTEELTKMGKIKVDIINVKRNIEKNFSELGGRVYHIIVEENSTKIAGDQEVKELIECIKILEKELDIKNEELNNVKSGEQKESAEDQSAATEVAETGTETETSADKSKK
jgi:hypothetical protein